MLAQVEGFDPPRIQLLGQFVIPDTQKLCGGEPVDGSPLMHAASIAKGIVPGQGKFLYFIKITGITC
jgi:hypothetical protein